MFKVTAISSSRGRKRDVDPRRLLIQRAKFSPHVMVSAGVCFGGKGTLHFVPVKVKVKVKVNTDFYMNYLFPKLIEDCKSLLPNNFVFQKDAAPAHSSRLTQEWIEQHSPEFVKKDEWPPNSPELNTLPYHVCGAMLERHKVFTSKPTNKAERKTVMEAIWEVLPQEAIDPAVLAFRKRLQACIREDGGHFEHLFKQNRPHQQTASFRAKNQFKMK